VPWSSQASTVGVFAGAWCHVQLGNAVSSAGVCRMRLCGVGCTMMFAAIRSAIAVYSINKGLLF